MNKIIKNKKFYLAIAFVFAVVAMCAFVPKASAQVLDNFEYWDTPKNHGWTAQEPAYPGGFPIWGINVGEGQLVTVIDFQEGSRVLEVFYPSNVYVPGMQKYMIARAAGTPNPVLSLKMRAPVSIETWDSYDITVVCSVDTDADDVADAQVAVNMIPRAVNSVNPVEVPEATATLDAATGTISVNVGRESEDGSWHLIVVDLAAAIGNATGGAVGFVSADQVIIAGNQYRCDDIMFSPVAPYAAAAPYLFHINHVFTQLFGGYQRTIFASHEIFDSTILPVNGNIPNTAILAEVIGCSSLCEVNFDVWQTNVLPTLAAADPAIDLAGYIAALDAYAATLPAGTTMGDVYRAGQDITIGLGVGGADITVNARQVFPCDIPILLVQPPPAAIIFSANIGGAHETGTCTGLVVNAPLDTPMGYMPLYCNVYSTCNSVKLATSTGNNYLTQDEIMATAQGLYYAGYNTWPNVGILNIPPQQTVENMVITVVAGLTLDGVNVVAEDIESFLLETVNYPVTNYPPVIEDVDDQIFEVGVTGTYQLNATDADSFSISPAGVFANDIENLVWEAYLAGYPSYQYGPYTEPLINQKTGLVSFTPVSEGVYEMVVTVRDPKGAEAYASFNIFCVNPNTWLNHPPVMLGDWDHPMIGQAGKPLTLDFSGIVDPDGEPLYYSCNIGAIGYVDGVPIWTFNTNYPGTYLVEIVAYDTSGGYLVIPQEVVITPWWSI
jgi:hypothetical protein